VAVGGVAVATTGGVADVAGATAAVGGGGVAVPGARGVAAVGGGVVPGGVAGATVGGVDGRITTAVGLTAGAPARRPNAQTPLVVFLNMNGTMAGWVADWYAKP